MAQEHQSDIQYLNTNKEIVALSCGKLDPRKPSTDLIFIGSKTNLLVYDNSQNADVFDKEVNDGLSSLGLCATDVLPDIGQPVVIVGGNCSITGFDVDGEERFWTVSGDNVSSLGFWDFNGDQVDELIAGSDDFAIRVFKGEEIVHDITEKAKVQHLEKIDGNDFAYALSNGAFGVYVGSKKMWKARNKNKVTALCGVDFSADGTNKLLVVGFESGYVEVRKHRSGEVVYSTNLEGSGGITKLFFYDY